MPARAFVDSDSPHQVWLLDVGVPSKCPRGHLLILINLRLDGALDPYNGRRNAREGIY